MASTEASSATFDASAMATVFPRSAFSSAASFSAPARFRSAMKTDAPEAASPRTISSPKPWAPPVTSAILFATTDERAIAEEPRERASAAGFATYQGDASFASRRARASSRSAPLQYRASSPPARTRTQDGRITVAAFPLASAPDGARSNFHSSQASVRAFAAASSSRAPLFRAAVRSISKQPAGAGETPAPGMTARGSFDALMHSPRMSGATMEWSMAFMMRTSRCADRRRWPRRCRRRFWGPARVLRAHRHQASLRAEGPRADWRPRTDPGPRPSRPDARGR